MLIRIATGYNIRLMNDKLFYDFFLTCYANVTLLSAS